MASVRYARVPKTGSKSLLNAVEKIGCNQLTRPLASAHICMGTASSHAMSVGCLFCASLATGYISLQSLKDKPKGGASKTDDGRLEISCASADGRGFAFAFRANESLRRILWQEEMPRSLRGGRTQHVVVLWPQSSGCSATAMRLLPDFMSQMHKFMQTHLPHCSALKVLLESQSATNDKGTSTSEGPFFRVFAGLSTRHTAPMCCCGSSIAATRQREDNRTGLNFDTQKTDGRTAVLYSSYYTVVEYSCTTS